MRPVRQFRAIEVLAASAALLLYGCGTTHEAISASAKTAAAVVLAHGYTAEDPAQYHPGQTLEVLIGTLSYSTDRLRQKAFFFIGSRFAGTDTLGPSVLVRIVSQSNDAVVLAYPHYGPSDNLFYPRYGYERVEYKLEEGRIVRLGALPPTYVGQPSKPAI